MNGYKLQSKQLKVAQEDQVSKTGQFGTLTCSPVSPHSGTTLSENQGRNLLCLYINSGCSLATRTIHAINVHHVWRRLLKKRLVQAHF